MALSLADTVLPKSVRDGIERTIEPLIYLRSNGDGKCSRKTRDDRRQLYFLMMAQLWDKGFKVRKLESLAGKHVQFLMTLWHSQKVAARTLHTRLKGAACCSKRRARSGSKASSPRWNGCIRTSAS